MTNWNIPLWMVIGADGGLINKKREKFAFGPSYIPLSGTSADKKKEVCGRPFSIANVCPPYWRVNQISL